MYLLQYVFATTLPAARLETSRNVDIQAAGTDTLPFTVANEGNGMAILSDQGLIALRSEDGRFATVSFNGSAPHVVPPCAAGHSASLAYQPFVFA